VRFALFFIVGQAQRHAQTERTEHHAECGETAESHDATVTAAT